MNPIEKILPQLKSLRLSGILDTIEVRNQQAIEQKLSHLEFLALVLGDEYERRENKKLHRRLRKANFQPDRTLENFRFDAPGLDINKAQVFDIATGLFVGERVNVLIVGPTGVGKSPSTDSDTRHIGLSSRSDFRVASSLRHSRRQKGLQAIAH